MNFFYIVPPAGESGLASTGGRESQHGRAYAAHVRRGAAADLHPHAPGLVSSLRQQRDLPEGGQTEQQRTAEPGHRAGAQRRENEGQEGRNVIVIDGFRDIGSADQDLQKLIK